MHVTGAWNPITNLAPSASYGNKPWKDVKRRNFRSLLIGYHGHEGPLIHLGIWMRWFITCGKDKYQACANCSGVCYFAWGVPWFGGLSFVSRVWFEESPTNTPFKMLLSNYDPENLQPAPNLHNCRCQKRTAVAICCRRQLSCCPVAVNPEFISVPRRSASSFNSNTVRSCDESPQFGWVWSTLHGCTTRMHKWVDCWLRQCGASTRNMSWGGMKTWIPCPGNPTFCWLLYYAILCWRSTGRINRYFTMVYHLWQPRSQCFENPLKTNVDLLFGGWFFSTECQQLFLRSSTHNAQVQRQLRPLSRATKTSVFFHGTDTTGA